MGTKPRHGWKLIDRYSGRPLEHGGESDMKGRYHAMLVRREITERAMLIEDPEGNRFAWSADQKRWEQQ